MVALKIEFTEVIKMLSNHHVWCATDSFFPIQFVVVDDNDIG